MKRREEEVCAEKVPGASLVYRRTLEIYNIGLLCSLYILSQHSCRVFSFRFCTGSSGLHYVHYNGGNLVHIKKEMQKRCLRHL